MGDPRHTRPRRQLTVGVLGHVDHGKTTLVRALTGIETDRLAEERERGLSIVPGYAWFDSDDRCIDLIDAPGHQAFIRAMIGAASGIDAAMLVIAANEGVMPQTREHIAVARLLGIATGIVVLTKCDLVSAEALQQVRSRIEAFVAETCLAGSQILDVAAPRGDGVETLRAALAGLEASRELDIAIPFHMPIDRSFTMSGFGRVVTGTVHAGTVRVGDELMLTPGDRRVRVRGIQVHGSDAAQAGQGERAAINLRGGAADSAARGMVLGTECAMQQSRRLDVLLEPVAGHADAVRNGAALRVLIGTAEAQARLRLLEHDGSDDGGCIPAQLRCDRVLPARVGMRFVLRSNSPGETVAGGVVVIVDARRRRRFDQDGNRELMELAHGTRAQQLRLLVDGAGPAGVERRDLAQRLGVGMQAVEALLGSSDDYLTAGSRICSASGLEALAAEVDAALQAFHESYPQELGMKHVDLCRAMPADANDDLVQLACERLRDSGRIAADNGLWYLCGFDPAAGMSAAQRKLAEAIEAQFARAGVASPPIFELTGKDTAKREALSFLLDTGRVVRLQTRDRDTMLALHATALRSAQDRIRSSFPYPAKFAVKDVRDLLGTTRRHAVPLLEHLDATGFTLRIGDVRQLRR